MPKESSINSNPCHLQSYWSASRILSLAFSTRVFFLYQNICTGKENSRVEMSISRYHWQVGCFDASNSFSKFGKARVIVPLLYTYVQSATFSLLGVCVFMCVREWSWSLTRTGKHHNAQLNVCGGGFCVVWVVVVYGGILSRFFFVFENEYTYLYCVCVYIYMTKIYKIECAWPSLILFLSLSTHTHTYM